MFFYWYNVFGDIMENKSIDLDSNIQYLKGVGPKMAELFKKINIYTIRDLIEYYPRAYEDRTKLYTISELIVGENALFIADVVKPVQVLRKAKQKHH